MHAGVEQDYLFGVGCESFHMSCRLFARGRAMSNLLMFMGMVGCCMKNDGEEQFEFVHRTGVCKVQQGGDPTNYCVSLTHSNIFSKGSMTGTF